MSAPEDTGPPPPGSQRRTMHLLLAAVSMALVWILLPFYGAILWATVIALLFRLLFGWLVPRLKGRSTVAAVLTMVVASVMVILPEVLVLTALARQAATAVEQLKSGELNPALLLRGLFDALPEGLMSLLARFGWSEFDVVQRKLAEVLTQGSSLIATQTLSVGQDAFSLSVSLLITVFLAFFLVRDGAGIVHTVQQAVPLAEGHKQALVAQFGTVLRATVRGNLVIALVQGVLGGLALYALGVGGALLWAVLMAVLSLLPAVGASLVWGPMAVWLLLTGHTWSGVALIAWGVLAIGLVDNLLRPLLVGRDTGMPDYLVLISTFGGIAVLGLNGFVVGPTVAAMFIAAWHIQATH
ncbi:AI-2E family transporter [Hydrogenophaga sp. PAMC20947]|uniref:AI-2E family transporter n=1 Tax=Hydrogenophaga sp. PAMC20947 TaxID=2565558 RepID=UPI001FF94A85|nr:AI-2E family transporter [Hydrogenophaga sp. PAMC20947]